MNARTDIFVEFFVNATLKENVLKGNVVLLYGGYLHIVWGEQNGVVPGSQKRPSGF